MYSAGPGVQAGLLGNRFDDFGSLVYAVVLELGFNQYGKAILAACFINDLGTVLALGLIFSPFTRKTLLLPAISLVSLLILPFVTGWFFERHGPRIRTGDQVPAVSAVRTGQLAVWSGSEASYPPISSAWCLQAAQARIIS